MGHLAETDAAGPVQGRDGSDPLVRAIELNAAALAALLSAAVVARNPHRGDGDTTAAADAVRKAVRALDEAAAGAREIAVFADLLAMTD